MQRCRIAQRRQALTRQGDRMSHALVANGRANALSHVRRSRTLDGLIVSVVLSRPRMCWAEHPKLCAYPICLFTKNDYVPPKMSCAEHPQRVRGGSENREANYHGQVYRVFRDITDKLNTSLYHVHGKSYVFIPIFKSKCISQRRHALLDMVT